MEQLPVRPSVRPSVLRTDGGAGGGRYLWRPRRNRPRGNEEAEPAPSREGTKTGVDSKTETAATYVVIVPAFLPQVRKSNQPERLTYED